MPKDKEESPDRLRKKPASALPVLFTILLLLLVLIAVASFLPGRRLWGVNHFAFYPAPVRIGAIFLMALSFIPVIARKTHSVLAGFLDNLRSRRMRLKWIFAVIPVVSMFVFIYFRSSTLLLGDGRLVVRNFEYVSEGYTNVVTRDISTILTEEKIARGATILYYVSVKISEGIFNSSPVNGIRIFNCILGGILIFVFLRILLLGSMSTELGIWMALLTLSSGAMELFFGYIENYPPLIFFAFLYLISGFVLIHRPRGCWMLINCLCLLIGVFMHIQAVLLVPSFVLLLGLFLAGKRGKVILRYMTPALIAMTFFGAYIAWAFTVYRENFLHLGAGENFYGIITPAHWLDILNEMLILLPVFPLLAVMAVAGFWPAVKPRESRQEEAAGKPRRPGSSRGSDAGDWFSLKAEWHFALLILLPALLFLVVFKPEIGMPRDWDLFTITFVGLLPLSLLVINRFLGMKRAKAVPLITVPALVMSVLMGIAWIGINSSPSRATDRFEKILEYDRTNVDYVYEILAKHYYSERQLDKAIAVVEEALSMSSNPRMYAVLGTYYEEGGRIEDAINVLYMILQKWPDHRQAARARRKLVELLDDARRYGELLKVARDGTRFHPEEPIYYFFLGKMLLGQGKFQEGIEALLECKSLNPPPAVLQQIEDVFERLQSEGKL